MRALRAEEEMGPISPRENTFGNVGSSVISKEMAQSSGSFPIKGLRRTGL